ncbi:flagellar brake protein [Anaerobacillus sp. MEB173]|uniref:flagellar brake protein n=1 Tax=Anaerobacillus sp. MEB173 TaxID=3383345 RepID=UPI003F91ECFB
MGDTIFLEVLESESEDKKRFRCRLVDRINEKLLVDYPINEKTKKIGFFNNGTKFKAWFISKDRSIYLFETEVEGRRHDNIPMLILKDPGSSTYRRIQRRQYVRVKTSIDVAVHPKNDEFSPFTTITIDISGGGLAIVLPANRQLYPNSAIYCWLVLHTQSGEIHYIHSECKVIRVYKDKSGDMERASLQFVTISEQDRQTVIRYCFERQLQLKRKKNKEDF